MYKKIPGTKDILPEESLIWQKIEETSRRIFTLYNYQELRLPILEQEGLFNRSLGQDTEIISKQMFLVKNSEETYALRPEGTASVVRAFLENNLDKTCGFSKFYYLGAMFRLERPQKGRLRQFHHIGCEAIGSQDASLDIEVISLAANLLKAYGVRGSQIKINSLGCPKDKEALADILRKEIKGKLKQLCPDCNIRFKQNVLRILDCKKAGCKEITEGLGLKDAYLCLDCKGHFQKIRAGLDSLKIEYQVQPYLVRGLDYYTRTVFEITHPNLGAQDALGAGGRYDNLVKSLGGQAMGAIGFAFGVERLILAFSRQPKADMIPRLVYLIALGDQAKGKVVNLLSDLRNAGIASDTDYEDKSIKGAMRKANDLKAKLVLIIGEDELKKNTVTLKDMSSGEQLEIIEEKIIDSVLEKLQKIT
jgi:histidyl-tRNA synthetase